MFDLINSKYQSLHTGAALGTALFPGCSHSRDANQPHKSQYFTDVYLIVYLQDSMGHVAFWFNAMQDAKMSQKTSDP